MTRPKRSLGQNFLVDPNVQRRIVEAIDPHADDDVLEIGPGRGALTRLLAGRVRYLVAVELDDELAASLRDEFGLPGETTFERIVHRGERGGRGERNEGDRGADAVAKQTDPGIEQDRTGVRIVHGDALTVEPAAFFDDVARVKGIGNIPYNITSPLIFHLLDRAHRVGDLVLMVQKEVATRITAHPGSKDYGALTVGVQSVARVERLFHVGRQAFRPVPDVDSTVVRITPIRPFPLTGEEERDLRALTQAAFQWRRKQLQKTLRASPAYALSADEVIAVANATGLDLSVRPEDLGPEQLCRLARALRAQARPHAVATG